MNRRNINIRYKKKQALTAEKHQLITQAKRIKPNRERIQGRMASNIMPIKLIQDDPIAYMETLTKKQKALLNLLISLGAQYKHIDPTHQWLADQLGCTKRYVIYMIDHLESLGLVTTCYRHYQSCLYKLTGWFRMPGIAEKLSKWLPGLRSFCMALLLCIPHANALRVVPEARFTQQIKEEELYINIILGTSKREGINHSKVLQGRSLSPEQLKLNARRAPYRRQQELSAHQRDDCELVYNAKYGGTGLYDRKTSQFELELQQRIHERQKRKYAMSYNYEDEKDSQPRYDDPVAPRIINNRKFAYPAESVYAPYVHKERKPEDPVQASDRLIEWTQSEKFKQFEKLFGREIALSMCNKIVSNALEDQK